MVVLGVLRTRFPPSREHGRCDKQDVSFFRAGIADGDEVGAGLDPIDSGHASMWRVSPLVMP